MEITETQDLRPLGSEPPPILQSEGREEWRRVWRQLGKLRCLHDVDRQQLMAYCLAFENFIKYSRAMQEGKDVFSTEKGYEIKSPYSTLQREQCELMLKLAKEFGMTPRARQTMNMMEKEAEDEFTKFCKQAKS